MARPDQWLSGARPRTLPAAVAPVLVGSGLGVSLGQFSWWKGVLALLVALALQVGVNYANDYSDGVRGTDTERVGPMRLVGSGAASPAAVRAAAFGCFAVAGAAGVALAAVTAWWLLPVGAACILAAWFYTGGPRPYGYLGLGEVFVFVFFGLVAVLGTAYVHAERLSWTALALAVGVGLLACALLVVNNLRDVTTDAAAGKRTLAVLLGAPRTRHAYALLMAGAFVAVLLVALRHPWCLLALAAAALAARPVRTVLAGAEDARLIAALGDTGRTEIGYAVLLTVGLVLGR